MKILLQKVKNHHGIQGILDEQKDKWQAFPAFVEAKKRLDDLLDQSDLLRGVIGNKSNSITQSKTILKAEMRKGVVLIADALTAFAEEKENNNLLILLDACSRRLNKARRDIDVYDACAAYMELATPYQTDIVDYRLSVEMFEKTLELLKDYKKHISLPNTVIKSNKTSRKALITNTRTISKLLKTRIDKLVNLMAEEYPELAEKYYALRKLNKVARRKSTVKNSNQPQSA